MKKIRKTKVKGDEFNDYFGVTEYIIGEKYWKVGNIFYLDFGLDDNGDHMWTILKITHDRRVPNDSFICDMFTNDETKDRNAIFFKSKPYSTHDFLFDLSHRLYLMSEEEYVLFLLQRGLSEHDHQANEGS